MAFPPLRRGSILGDTRFTKTDTDGEVIFAVASRLIR